MSRRVIDAHEHLDVPHLPQAVKLMDQNGIVAAVDVTPNPFETLYEKLAAFAAYPGRFHACCGPDHAGFGTPSWAGRETERLARAAEMGVVGIKFAKRWGLTAADGHGKIIPIDHEALDPLYEQAGRLGLAVVFHVGDPKAFFRPADERNERYDELRLNPTWSYADRGRYPYDWWALVRQIEKVLRGHPSTTFVGAHFGCAAEEIGYVADVLRDNPNYYVDTAARVSELGRHDARCARDFFVEMRERIIFGTDLGVREEIMLGAPQGFAPGEADVKQFYEAHWRYFETTDAGIDHPTPIQGRWKVDAIGLPPDVLALLYEGNARRVFLARR